MCVNVLNRLFQIASVFSQLIVPYTLHGAMCVQLIKEFVNSGVARLPTLNLRNLSFISLYLYRISIEWNRRCCL